MRPCSPIHRKSLTRSGGLDCRTPCSSLSRPPSAATQAVARSSMARMSSGLSPGSDRRCPGGCSGPLGRFAVLVLAGRPPGKAIARPIRPVPVSASVTDPELHSLHDEEDHRQDQVEAENPHRRRAASRPNRSLEEGEFGASARSHGAPGSHVRRRLRVRRRNGVWRAVREGAPRSPPRGRRPR